MPISVEKTYAFDCPVQVKRPRSKDAPHEFTARFLELDQDTLVKSQEGEDKNRNLLRHALVGWTGFVDESGAEIPFSSEARERLIALPSINRALIQAYAESIALDGSVADAPGPIQEKNFAPASVD